MVSKFLLLIFMSKYLDPSILGDYGLLYATVMYAIYFVGMDFYAYSTRKIIECNKDTRGVLIKNYFFACLVFVVLFGMIYVILVLVGIVPERLIYVLLLLVVLEYVSQELYRLMIALSLTLQASVLLFVRMGLWPLVASAVLILFPEYRQIEMIISVWVAGSFFAVLYGAVAVRGRVPFSWHSSVDWKWIRGGILVAIPFLVASLSMRGVMVSDRYIINLLNGADMLGVYVFYASIAGLIAVVVDATIFIFSYPKLISVAKENDKFKFIENVSKLFKSVAAVSVSLAVLSSLCISYVVQFIGQEIYYEYIGIYYVMTVVFVLLNISNVYHYALYALGKDKELVIGNVLCLLVFLVAVVCIAITGFVYTVSFSMILAYIFLLVWKLIIYKKHAELI